MQNIFVEEVIRNHLVNRGQTDAFCIRAMHHDDTQHVYVHMFVHVEACPYGSIVESVKVVSGIQNAKEGDRFFVMLKMISEKHFSPWEQSVFPSL